MIRPLLSAALIAAAFAVALFFEGAQSWLYAPALLCLLAGLLIAAFPPLIRHADGRSGACPALPDTAPALLLFAFWIYTTLSLLWSQTPFPSLVTYLVLSCLPLTFFGLLLNPDRRRFAEAARTALLIALTLPGFWAILQTTLLADRFGGRAAHPLLDANNLAALMAMGLLPALGFALTAANRRALYPAVLSVLVLTGGLTATQSRGGLLSCAVMAAILLLILGKDVLVLRRRRAALLLGGMAAVFFALSLPAPGHGAAGRLASLAGAPQDEDVMNRPVLWRATLGVIAERPFTGTGLGSFYMTYPARRPLADTRSAGQWAHNDPLQFAAEMGIAAPLLFYAFVAALILAHRRFLRHERDGARRAAASGPLLGFMAVVLHSHVEFQLYVMPVLIVSGAWLALWTVETTPPHRWKPLRLPASGIACPALLIAVAALFAVPAIRCGLGAYYLDRAIAEMRRARPASFTRLLDRAERWAPASFADPAMQRAGLYVDLLRRPEGLFSQEEQQTMAADTLALLDRAEKAMPFWSAVNARRAALYGEMKEKLAPDWRAKAERELRAALRKNPLDMKARALLVELLAARGDSGESAALLREGLRRPHDQDDGRAMRALLETLNRINAPRPPEKAAEPAAP